MNKKIINLMILILFTMITGYIIITSKELAEIPELLRRTDRFCLSIAILLMTAYVIFNALIIQTIGKNISTQFTFRKSLFLAFVGQYYSLITPFASGGQPAQVYLMKSKYGVSYTKGTTLTIKKFIVFQVIISLYALTMFAMKYNLIFMKKREIIIFIMIGLFINILGCILIITLSFNDKVIKKIVDIIIGFLQKFRFFKKYNKEKVYRCIDDYVENIGDFKNNKWMMIKVFLLTFLQITCYFSITYFIYLSLGFNEATITDILAIQTVLYVVVSFIPTPGGIGASESGFYVLFSIFFSRDVLLYAMILWRIIVYYGVLLISGVVVFLDSISFKTKIKN
ncbi:lysylphosphatidylglycerol synthase transmembrane domain-containing protein [Natranaerovirga pectinivora]|nr:lysylphosphatidylglycerol synthase transmembrane domain-containing protein [Natranaerovirga pectinivora]